MEVSTRNAIDATLRAMEPSAAQEALQQKVQVALLKKTLQSQQDQAAELMKMAEGKGRLIDIRA